VHRNCIGADSPLYSGEFSELYYFETTYWCRCYSHCRTPALIEKVRRCIPQYAIPRGEDGAHLAQALACTRTIATALLQTAARWRNGELAC
jgi:hypothetical protein